MTTDRIPSRSTPPTPHPAPPAGLAVDQEVAAGMTGLSSKTLGRLADRGEPVGRIKVGRRVLYHLPTLEGWFKLQANAGGQP